MKELKKKKPWQNVLLNRPNFFFEFGLNNDIFRIMYINLFLTYGSLLEKCALVTCKLVRSSYFTGVYICLSVLKKIEEFKVEFKI